MDQEKTGSGSLFLMPVQPPQSPSSHLILCIHSGLVQRYSTPSSPLSPVTDAQAALNATLPSKPPPPPGPPLALPVFSNQDDPTHIRLLSRPLSEFQAIAMHEHSGWLQSLAHDICGYRQPQATLYRLDRENPVEWTPVNPNDPLEAKIYEYKPPAAVRLSKQSRRTNQSRTQTERENASSSMRNEVFARDNSCWFCDDEEDSVNSRIVPKRMGDEQVRMLGREWCNLPNCQWDVFTTQMGIRLCLAHNGPFNGYKIGLRHVPLRGVDSYMIHFFESHRQSKRMHIHHSDQLVNGHGYCITAPNPTHPQNPPAELFKWHYMQCVLKWFAHEDYTSLSYIRLSELPLRGRDDDDSEYDSGEDDFSKLWPSAIFDFGRWEKINGEEEAARSESVANWVSVQSLE